ISGILLSREAVLTDRPFKRLSGTWLKTTAVGRTTSWVRPAIVSCSASEALEYGTLDHSALPMAFSAPARMPEKVLAASVATDTWSGDCLDKAKTSSSVLGPNFGWAATMNGL